MYRQGDFYRICDRTGRKVLVSQTVKEWTGAIVDRSHAVDLTRHRRKPSGSSTGSRASPLEHPRVPPDALRGMPDYYKIKLRSAGYRLVYRVEDDRITVVVVAVGRRRHSEGL